MEETISNIRHGGVVSILSLVTIMLTAIIVSVLVLLHNAIRTEVTAIKDATAIIVFLHDSISEIEQQRLQFDIEDLEMVERVVYVSKKQALARGRQIFDEFASIVQGFELVNPLPASFEVHLKDEALEQQILRKTASYIRVMSEKIDEVTYEQFTSTFIRRAEFGVLGLGSIMGVASIIIVAFSVVLTVYFRREEIEILRLVGASSWYIGFPLIIQGGILGGFGSLLGVTITFALFRAFTTQFRTLSFIPFHQTALIVLVSIVFGLLASIFPTLKYADV